jgi:iron(III) transport system substrate-binding protein
MPDRNREETMTKHRFSRREVLNSATALVATVFASPLRAAAPEASAITPALVEAAKKEGKLAFYTAMDLAFAERLAKTFEERFPGVAVRVERSGAERIFTRIAQEYGGNINVVDVVNTADQAHCIVWKRNGWLAPYLPEEAAKHFDPQYYDPDALHVTTRILISPIAYNTNLVKKEDAPKSFADLLDPKWAGKLVKGHPAYKKISLGERAVMVDGAGYLVIRYKEDGQPVEIVYPEEGTPLAGSPSAVFKAAPNPNAARLFQNWMHSREAQQLLVDWARQYSPHRQTVEKPGIRKLADIKLMKEDPESIEKMGDEIKTRYAQIFRV